MFWLFALLAFDCIAVGVALCALGYRSHKGLEMNSFWGMRTKKTMVSDEIFRKANLAIWRTYVFQGCVCLVSGLAIFIVGITNSEAYSILALIAFSNLLILVPSIVYGYYKAHRSIQ